MSLVPVLLFTIIWTVVVRTVLTTSYTSDGLWEPPNDNNLCSNFVCSPNNLTWVQKNEPTPKFYNNVSSCDALVAKGIKIIYFHGDSYMRQIYAAMLITLNGDFKYGSQANPAVSPHCAFHRQFFEKNCGTHQLNHAGMVCDNRIHLEPYLNFFESTNDCSRNNGSVVLWSFGNHKCTRYGRTGVNNATELQGCLEQNICRHLKAHESDGSYSPRIGPHNTCSVWWVTTHYRVRGYFEDETVERVKGFNEGMRRYFDSGGCGAVNYIDVYNMTQRLTVDHLADAERMTYDNVHWGMEVNLVKAQIIINALISDHR